MLSDDKDITALNNSRFVISPPDISTLPVSSTSKLFPINRVFCIGRNYAAHAIEMGHNPDKEPPFFFQKSPVNVTFGEDFPYPPKSQDVHFEFELVAALKSGGTNIPVDKALDCVYGYGLGFDMTRRDLQGEAKKLGRPWDVGKAFEKSAPCGKIYPVTEIGHPSEGAVTLDVNNIRKQTGDLNQMIWKTSEMIAILSEYFELRAGDLIMTGTPSGVGPCLRGDILHGVIEGVGELTVTVR